MTAAARTPAAPSARRLSREAFAKNPSFSSAVAATSLTAGRSLSQRLVALAGGAVGSVQHVRACEREFESLTLSAANYGFDIDALLAGPRRPLQEAVALWLEDHCDKVSNAASIAQKLSRAFTHMVRCRSIPAWSNADKLYFQGVSSRLRESYGVDKKEPATLKADTLRAIELGTRDLRSTSSEHQAIWGMTLIAYTGMLRPIDFLGPLSDFRAGNVETLTTALGTKVHRVNFRVAKRALQKKVVGEKEYADIPSIPGTLDAGVYMAACLAKASATGPETPLFTSPKGGFMTAAEYNRGLRELCAHAGVPAIYTARCTRKGRRTDYQAAGVAPEVLNFAGRWRHTKSSLTYQESNASLVDLMVHAKPRPLLPI